MEKKTEIINNNDYKFIPELGKSLPRVTHILKVLSKGQAYESWLKKQGNKADTLLSTAGDIGTGIHNLLQSIGKGEQVDLEKVTPQEKKWLGEFRKWEAVNIDKFLETEKTVWTDEYCGTLDSLVLLKDKRVALLDYKTGKYCYDTYHAQVGAYWNAYMWQHKIKIDTAFILRFDKNGGKMEVKEVEDLDYQLSAFINALDLWKWKKEMYARNSK